MMAVARRLLFARGVTAPRQILPNATYLITRRCLERRTFLRPSEELNALLKYILAVAVERHGVQLHAFCVLSNHLHLVVTDPAGRLPAFEQYWASLVARSVNALLGRWETFWAPGSYSAVRLLDQEAVMDKLAYTLANPSSAGLVRRGAEWPGLWSAPDAIGGPPVIVPRPAGFFQAEGTMPPKATLQLVAPPGIEELEEFRSALRQEVTRREDATAERLAAERLDFAGPDAVLAQGARTQPASREPRRRLKPLFASRDKAKRVEAIQNLKRFLGEYREAWRAFAGGLRETLFPHGTYWMRVAFAVPCMPAG